MWSEFALGLNPPSFFSDVLLLTDINIIYSLLSHNHGQNNILEQIGLLAFSACTHTTARSEYKFTCVDSLPTPHYNVENYIYIVQ